MFQGNLKDVSKSFKGASKMFNEVLLCNFVSHGSHRSYPSRRRACSIRRASLGDQEIFHGENIS